MLKATVQTLRKSHAEACYHPPPVSFLASVGSLCLPTKPIHLFCGFPQMCYMLSFSHLLLFLWNFFHFLICLTNFMQYLFYINNNLILFLFVSSLVSFKQNKVIRQNKSKAKKYCLTTNVREKFTNINAGN